MKINLLIAKVEINIKWATRKSRIEEKVLKVLLEKGKIEAIKYYRNDLNDKNVLLYDAKRYVDAIEEKYGVNKK